MQTLSDSETFLRLLMGYKIIDVRAPVEYAQGHLPGSVNLPVLDDHERALVGTCYKTQGSESAIELGYSLVSGENLEKKQKSWVDFLAENPKSILTCFRGGLRSQTTQKAIAELGFEIPRIGHGYKGLRNYLSADLAVYAKEKPMRILTGNTGSGKTHLLNEIKKFYPVVDLEGLARHRGSAFGKIHGKTQPEQASFENALAVDVLRYDHQSDKPRVLFEDESRLIGSRHIPEIFFDKMRASPVIKLNIELEQRIENIFTDYIMLEEFRDPLLVDVIFDKYMASLARISKKLGGLRTSELVVDLNLARQQIKAGGPEACSKSWIEKFLAWYYDPMYEYSFDLRKPEVEFSGNEREVTAYLRSLV